MPDEVIARVNALAKAEGQPELLTFYDRRGLAIGELNPPDKIESEELTYDGYDDEADGLEPATVNEDYGLEDPDAELADNHPDAANEYPHPNEYHERAGNQDGSDDKNVVRACTIGIGTYDHPPT